MLFCCYASSECIKSNLIRIYSKKKERLNLILTCLHTKNRMEQLKTKSRGKRSEKCERERGGRRKRRNKVAFVVAVSVVVSV